MRQRRTTCFSTFFTANMPLPTDPELKIIAARTKPAKIVHGQEAGDIQSFRKDIIAEFTGNYAKTWGADSDTLITMVDKLSDDFFIAIKNNVLPKACIIITESGFGISEWWRRIVRFVPVFSDPANHTTLTLITDPAYRELASQYMLNSFTVSSAMRVEGTIHAFPFHDLELGKLIFKNPMTRTYYQCLCLFDMQYNLFAGDVTTQEIRKTFNNIIADMDKGKKFEEIFYPMIQEIQQSRQNAPTTKLRRLC